MPIPCTLHDGQPVNLEPTGLPPLTTIAIGLCTAAASPRPDDCTPGTTYFDNRSAVVDLAGAARLSLVAERHLLLRDRTVDCAVTACELRTLILDRQSGVTLATFRDRVQFDDPAQFALDLGDPFALTHHADHVLRLQGTDLDLHQGIAVEQCTRSTIKLAFGVDYPSCIRIPTGDVELANGSATVHFSPSRWSFSRGSAVDCALASHPCWLSVLVGGNFAVRAAIAVSGNAARPTLTAAPHDGLLEPADITLTLAAAPPRQWASIVYCLDEERARQAPPAQGDGADGCTSLDADLSPLGADRQTAWPPDEITLRATIPRFLRWQDTDYDCADLRGCRIVYLSGSDTFADYGLDVTVHFAP